jgi:16S rRNA (uracil1498-N3)-methyltransferase
MVCHRRKEMNRFFVNQSHVEGQRIRLDRTEDIHHLSKVLRLGEGDQVMVSDSVEYEYLATIKEMGRGEVWLQVEEKRLFQREPRIRVTLFQGIPKQGKMEFVVQKCTELGMDSMVPVFMDRTVVVDRGDYWKKVVRYQSIGEEAAKQCHRGKIPEIRQAIGTEDMLDWLKTFELVVFPYEEEKETTIKSFLRQEGLEKKRIALIIGPEGGFSPREADEITAMGAVPVSLGKTILRTETAGMAAMAMMMYELELLE